MSNTDERPMLYDFITAIVDDVHALRPDMSRADIESSVGPIVCSTMLHIFRKTLDLLADDITETFDTAPEYSALVGTIAEHVRNFLTPKD